MPWADRWEVARITVVAVVVETGFTLTTLPRLARLLRVRVSFEPGMPPAHPPAPLPAWASHRLDLIRDVLRSRWTEPTCLRVSLVGAQRLRRLSPTIRIGVQRDGAGGLLAHAWLEVGGRSVDPAADSFVPMVRIDR